MCEKCIRSSSSPRQSEPQRLLREVETLRSRRHSNLISLLASYHFTSVESEYEVTTLHLIFPWADTNLWEWMNSLEPPLTLRDKSHHERRIHLCSAMCALESGLSYLHRESKGQITGHHDLKPENILVINNQLKIADFGRSHLRPATSGSDTEGREGLGTYIYQPPEYWGDDDRDFHFKHGRAFDVWSMGCIMIELATLAVDDWETGMVLKFKEERENNKIWGKPKLADIRCEGKDCSFHNNLRAVEKWVASLRHHKRSFGPLRQILNITLKMIAKDPKSRLYAWEAEMDLHEALNFDDRGHLLELGALRVQHPPPEIRNGFQTPLHRAATEGKCERLFELLDVGWPMFVQDEFGRTSFDLIEQGGNIRIRETFYERLGHQSNSVATIANRGSILLQMAKEGRVERVDDLLKDGVNPLLINSEGYCASHVVAQCGRICALERLLGRNRREQLKQRDFKWADTPLLKAASSGHANVVDYLLSPSPDIKYYPDIEDHQKEGKTALFLAAEWGHTEVISVLLRHKAQVFTQRVRDWKGRYGHEGETPIHAAARFGYPEALKLLLEAEDADRCLKHKDASGRTPELLALSEGNDQCVEVLRQRKK